MPVYEFLCRDCNRVFSFLARRPGAAQRTPRCPRCGGSRMTKRLSRFATGRKRAPARREGEAGAAEGAEPDVSPEQEARMERELQRLERHMDSIDEDDPRQLAAVMRRLCDAAGEPLEPEMDEMVRRLEAGEDPEKVEEEMADVLPDDEDGGPGGAPAYDDGLYDL